MSAPLDERAIDALLVALLVAALRARLTADSARPEREPRVLLQPKSPR
jgi:hypothetical protein